MRIIILILLMLSVSCALRAPQRHIANIDVAEKYGAHDSKRSLVQIFPSQNLKEISFYLYVQLKDKNGKFVDAKPNEFQLKTRKGSKISFDFERVLVGRYYLSILKNQKIESHDLDLFVQGRVLKEQFKLQMNRPHEKHTKLKLLKNNRNLLHFELRLADSKNRPLEVPEKPEILLDGPGVVEEMKHIKEGVWQFKVKYPDENHITYFSVRSMGITFQKLYRYQHIEKWEREPATTCSRNIFCD